MDVYKGMIPAPRCTFESSLTPLDQIQMRDDGIKVAESGGIKVMLRTITGPFEIPRAKAIVVSGINIWGATKMADMTVTVDQKISDLRRRKRLSTARQG